MVAFCKQSRAFDFLVIASPDGGVVVMHPTLRWRSPTAIHTLTPQRGPAGDSVIHPTTAKAGISGQLQLAGALKLKAT